VITPRALFHARPSSPGSARVSRMVFGVPPKRTSPFLNSSLDSFRRGINCIKRMENTAGTASKDQLRALLQEKSVCHGEFTLASGAKSDFYVDARITTFDPRGACLIGEVGWALLKQTAAKLNKNVHSGRRSDCTQHRYRRTTRKFLHPASGFHGSQGRQRTRPTKTD